MNFLIVLACSIVASLLLKKYIKKCPWFFYVLAVLLDALFIINDINVFPAIIHNLIFILMQKSTLSLALFVIVMYIGVLDKSSRISRYLMPIRAELSIFAWLVSLGHMVTYLMVYAPRILNGAGITDLNIIVSLAISLILFVLLLVLGVTSFNFVKQRMSLQTWKRAQVWAYVFFGLVYIHLVLLLLPSALNGGDTAIVSIIVYSVVFIGYFIARVVRMIRDRKPTKGA